MIESFKHRGLFELFDTGKTKRIGKSESDTIRKILDFLDAATSQRDLVGVRGFHPLKPANARRFAMKVTANWRVTFRWSEEDGKAYDVDYEDYH